MKSARFSTGKGKPGEVLPKIGFFQIGRRKFKEEMFSASSGS